MKLWYQSFANHHSDALNNYGKVLRAQIQAVADEGTSVDVFGLDRGGIADQYRYLQFLNIAELLDNVHRAMDEGYDAFLLGNALEPAINEAREFSTIPVIGLMEAATATAALRAQRFCHVTVSDKHRLRLMEHTERFGLNNRSVGTYTIRLDRILDLDAAFEEERERDRVLEAFEDAARQGEAAGAELIVVSAGVTSALLLHANVHRTQAGTPVHNGIPALIKMGEMAVWMQRVTGTEFVSRTGIYAPPPAGQLAEIRKHFGRHVYPMGS